MAAASVTVKNNAVMVATIMKRTVNGEWRMASGSVLWCMCTMTMIGYVGRGVAGWRRRLKIMDGGVCRT